MSLREGLPLHEAYDFMIGLCGDRLLRDDLIGTARSEPGSWAWRTLPDGSAMGAMMSTGEPETWSVRHILP